MGGLNEVKIGNLRAHINGEYVHFHDDGNSLKFVCDIEDFRAEAEEAMNVLMSDDGIYKIEGEGADESDLCFVKDGKLFYLYLTPRTNDKKELKKFLKGL